MKSAAFLLTFLLVYLLSPAQEDSVMIRKIANGILQNGKAYDNLRVLTKQIGPRLAGSSGMVKAEAWGEKTMKASGAEKTWMQECMVPHWVRGGTDEAYADYTAAKAVRKKLDVVALGNSIGTGTKGLKAPVIEVTSFEDLEKKKDQVKGKIVFYNYKFDPTFVNTFEAYSDANKYRGRGPSAASQLGAVGVIVRSMSHSTDNNPHTGGTRYDSAYPKIPAVAIGLRDADELSTILKTRPASVFIKTNGHFLPDTIGHNVIGELIGSKYPDEIITIGGHLDSWDNCEGAHDDGAGCVQTMEVLRGLVATGYKPQRTIRFVLFANEENGTRGGQKYAAEAKAKNEKHIFALESDEGGFTPRGFNMTGTDEQYKKMLAWKPLLAPYGTGEIARGGGGADIGPLNRTFKTPLAGLFPDSQRYFDIHHSRNDVFENVNKRELELGAVNMAALIYLIDKYGL
jgi:hypothetical protein